MLQQLTRDRVASQQARRDRKRYGHLQVGCVVADPQLSRRPLVELVDDLAQLATAKLSPLPPLEPFRHREQSPPELLFVCGCGILAKEAFDSFRRISHTLSPQVTPRISRLDPRPPRRVASRSLKPRATLRKRATDDRDADSTIATFPESQRTSAWRKAFRATHGVGGSLTASRTAQPHCP